jgi:hypothetical protein
VGEVGGVVGGVECLSGLLLFEKYLFFSPRYLPRYGDQSVMEHWIWKWHRSGTLSRNMMG